MFSLSCVQPSPVASPVSQSYMTIAGRQSPQTEPIRQFTHSFRASQTRLRSCGEAIFGVSRSLIVRYGTESPQLSYGTAVGAHALSKSGDDQGRKPKVGSGKPLANGTGG